MAFQAAKQRVLNRGVPPDSFLNELIAWGRAAPDDIFVPNPHADIYANVVAVLGRVAGIVEPSWLKSCEFSQALNRRGTGTRGLIQQTRRQRHRTRLKPAPGRSARTP